MANSQKLQLKANDCKTSKKGRNCPQFICSGCPTHCRGFGTLNGVSFPVVFGTTSQQHNIELTTCSSDHFIETGKSNHKSSYDELDTFGYSTKKEKNRLKRREERSNPFYRDKERARARLRMQEKRKDPAFRELERMKNKLRMRLLRQTDGKKPQDFGMQINEKKKISPNINIVQSEDSFNSNYNHFIIPHQTL